MRLVVAVLAVAALVGFPGVVLANAGHAPLGLPHRGHGPLDPTRLSSVPARTGLPALDLPPVRSFLPHPTVSPALTVIYPNGTVSNGSAPISVLGNHYRLTANFTGGILDERNGSFLDGNGSTLTADTSLTNALTVFNASFVRISGLTIQSLSGGINIAGTSDTRLSHDQVYSAQYGLTVNEASGLSISNSRFIGGYGIDVTNARWVNITSNVIQNQSYAGVIVTYSSQVMMVNNNGNGSVYGFISAYSDHLRVFSNQFNNTTIGVYGYLDSFLAIGSNQLFGAYYPIMVYLTSDLTASGDSGTFGYNAVYLSEVTNAQFSFERFSNFSGSALYLEQSTDVAISDSAFVRSSTGAAINYSTNVSLNQVNLSGFGYYGLESHGTDLLTAHRVNASDPSLPNAFAFYLVQDLEVTVESCRGDHSAFGIYATNDRTLNVRNSSFQSAPDFDTAAYISSSTQVNFVGNDLFNASSQGLSLYSVSQGNVSGNDVRNATYTAIAVSSSILMTIASNLITGAGQNSLVVYSSSELTITGNVGGWSVTPYASGLSAYSLDDSWVANNSFAGTNYSLMMQSCVGDEVQGNNLSSSYFGLYLFSDSNSVFEGNSLWNDTLAFEVGYDHGITVAHNNFLNDSSWAILSSLETIAWDLGYPGGGNYWSNHSGPDNYRGPGQTTSGPDGIVDLPVVLNSSNLDRYPLSRGWIAHSLTFAEVGLGSGTWWTVDLNGSFVSGNRSSITVLDPSAANLTVPYSIPGVSGYNRTSPGSGATSLTGTNVTIPVSFTPYTYSAIFHESGLSNGVAWSVTVGNVPLSTNLSYASHSLPNGSYPYTVAPVSGYALTTPSGNAVVNSSGVLIELTYVKISTGSNNGTNSSGGGGGQNSTGGGGGSNGSSGGTGGNGGGGGGSPSGGGTPAKSASTVSGFDPHLVYGLVGALILMAVLAALGFALWARSRRNPRPPAAQPWTPPATSEAPVGAEPSAANPISPAGTVPVVGAKPEWQEDPPDGSG